MNTRQKNKMQSHNTRLQLLQAGPEIALIVSYSVNITKIGRFENHYVFSRKPMVDDCALQSDERAASVIMTRWDFATSGQMQPNGWASNPWPDCPVEILLCRR